MYGMKNIYIYIKHFDKMRKRKKKEKEEEEKDYFHYSHFYAAYAQ